MTNYQIGLVVVGAMLIMLFLRIPISISMGIPALVGIFAMKGWVPLMTAIEQNAWSTSTTYSFSTIPMFVLMGNLLFVTGIATDLFAFFRALFGRIRGGQAMATIGASAVFAAASGSSWATCATIATVTGHEMLDQGYKKYLTGGSIVAGGTLGILIPPSNVLILYGIISGASIGKLLMAGVIPGIILTILYILTIVAIVHVDKGAAPTGRRYTWREKLSSLKSVFLVLLLFVIVIGSMYFGWASPTEAAGFGAIAAFLIGIFTKRLDWPKIKTALMETAKTCGFIFAITFCAYLLNFVFSLSKLPAIMVDGITSLNLGRGGTFCLIILLYLFLGMIMDTTSVIIVTVPLMTVLMPAIGCDLVWFGVVLVIMVEAAQITPPVGAGCFVAANTVPELPLAKIFKGAIFFVIPIIILIALLWFFPQLALFLPSTMM